MNWVKHVHTVSTFPPAETFNKPAKSVAKTMADPRVSPKGLGSAIRMVQYFINRGGKNLSATRRRELEKAKHLLQEMREREGSDSKGHSKDRPRQSRSKTSGRTKHSTRSHTKGSQRKRTRKSKS